MCVVLLDPRFPDDIPVAALSVLGGEIDYTDDVPVKVRWVLGDAAAATRAPAAGAQPVLVAMDDKDPKVVAAVAQGREIIASRQRGADVVPEHLRHVDEALSVMARARQIGEWERKQTHESLLPYLEEEAQEFANAVKAYVAAGGAGERHLKDELADVLLQVLFHAQLAAERGAFDFDAVAKAFVDKLRRRAPYLFDGTTDIVPEEVQEKLWQESKKASEVFDPLTADSSLLPPLVGLGELRLPDVPDIDD